MWNLKPPNKVKLIVGILAADNNCLDLAKHAVEENIGKIDLASEIWPFTQTDYYKDQTGENILKQFVSVEKVLSPARLAKIKLKTNKIEQQLAQNLHLDLTRPVNLDPGIIEPSKLILATTKNYSHRIYIGKKIYAEVTLIYDKGTWKPFDYTYPDYTQQSYFDFFTDVRTKLLEQLRSKH